VWELSWVLVDDVTKDRHSFYIQTFSNQTPIFKIYITLRKYPFK
jgi:hypothetical protein